MKHTILLCAVLAVSAAKGAEPAITFPAGTPPSFALVTEVDREEGTVTLQTSGVVAARRLRKKSDPNAAKRVEDEGPDTRRVTILFRIAVKYFRVEAGGRALGAEETWRRLRPGVMIVYQKEGKIDPAFRKLLAKDALIVAPAPKE